MLNVICNPDGTYAFTATVPAPEVDTALGTEGARATVFSATAHNEQGALNLFGHLLNPVKVYEVTEGEWYMGRSLDEARAAAFDMWSCSSLEDAIEGGYMHEGDGRELDADDMQRLRYVDHLNESGEPVKIPFAAALIQQLAAGDPVPGMFAMTDQ